MKKILIFLVLISLLAAPVLGYTLLEEPAKTPCKVKHNLSMYKDCEDITAATTTLKASCCLIDRLLTVGDYLFITLLILGNIMIVIAGYIFLTAGGDPNKISKAKTTLIYALIGMAVGFSAKIIVKAVGSFVAGE